MPNRFGRKTYLRYQQDEVRNYSKIRNTEKFLPRGVEIRICCEGIPKREIQYIRIPKFSKSQIAEKHK